MTVRVALVDDQVMFRAGIAMVLESQHDLEVVGQADDGDQVPALVAEVRPDVVVMDVRMARVDGVTATRRLRDSLGEDAPKVLVLTTFDLDEYVFEALRAGASGFLLKDTLPDELLAAIRIVADGEALLAPTVTRRLIEAFARQSAATPEANPGLDLLTEREREVLVEVAQGHTNAEVAERLFMSQATAKTHVSRLLTKLGARDRAQLVVVAYESGVVTPGGA